MDPMLYILARRGRWDRVFGWACFPVQIRSAVGKAVPDPGHCIPEVSGEPAIVVEGISLARCCGSFDMV
jgi:hypothetical protein